VEWPALNRDSEKMMTFNEKMAAEVWDIALTRLREDKRVHDNTFDQWFVNMTPLRLEDGTCLVVGMESEFLIEWVSDTLRLTEYIGEALIDIEGRDYSCRFEAGHPPKKNETAPVEAQKTVDDLATEKVVAAVKKTPVVSSNLQGIPASSSYTFDNFVVGEENRYAYTAARRAAEKPGLFNPLYIYGNTGTGKTHLLHAIAQETSRNNPGMVVRYATCEEILNCFVESLQSHQYGSFRSQLRDVDMLLVDDIHVLGSKSQLQEQFFNAFNALYHENKQIVLTSDKRPSEIAGLEARLISRFEQGVTTEIYAPGLEIRLAILRGMQQDFMVRFEDDILEFIASRISSNVRRLRGALMQLLSRVSLYPDMPITQEQVENVLHSVFEEELSSQLITVDDIQKKVADYFNLRISDLLSDKRPKSIAQPRMVAMYLSRKLTDNSFPQLGSAFGRNHATIINACEKVPELCEKDEDLRRAVALLERQLKS